MKTVTYRAVLLTEKSAKIGRIGKFMYGKIEKQTCSFAQNVVLNVDNCASFTIKTLLLILNNVN